MERREKMNAYITGDTHGNFDHIEQYCKQMGIGRNDIMIVLGDACLNYFDDERDDAAKESALKSPVTYFCIQGNHEMRPEHIKSYELVEWHDGKVWQDPKYPRLLFARDGDIYNIAGKSVLVIGGAYSVDKYKRLDWGYRWFSDEQPSEEIKQRVEQTLDAVNWKVDVVLSHTCPMKFMPTDNLLKGCDNVDNSTEDWLDSIEERLDYKKWYCGHFHINRKAGKLTFLHHEVLFFGSEI